MVLVCPSIFFYSKAPLYCLEMLVTSSIKRGTMQDRGDSYKEETG